MKPFYKWELSRGSANAFPDCSASMRSQPAARRAPPPPERGGDRVGPAPARLVLQFDVDEVEETPLPLTLRISAHMVPDAPQIKCDYGGTVPPRPPSPP
jgi:hypothetical protein